jgi:hypothetical protein
MWLFSYRREYDEWGRQGGQYHSMNGALTVSSLNLPEGNTPHFSVVVE